MMMRRLLAAIASLGLLASLVACTTGGPSQAGAHFVVSKDPSASWWPLDIWVEGLAPGHTVTITASAQSSGLWTSRATYGVPADGVVDLGTATPLLAPFSQPDAMGLFWSLARSNAGSSTANDGWSDGTVTIDLTAAVDGRAVATYAVHRMGLGTIVGSHAVFDSGFLGDFFSPTGSSVGLQPAVLVLDGADNGMQSGVLAAAQIAGLGYPALALSSFGSAGGVSSGTLHAETLLAALAWLRAQPGVDDDRVFVFGASRSAPLALWAAVQYPALVYGAIAPSGTTGVICTSPVPVPAITIGGAWVPCTTGTNTVRPADVLMLAQIQGPVVLACAGKDETLPNACDWMTAGENARGNQIGDTFLRATGATHALYIPPYSPLYLPSSSTAQATENARVAFWRAVERTLRGASRT
ncbi:acyl-CoA thioesterase/bile acid-CoA:amino acid N-acyltransferase family protein [Diaminobutyricibacter sp. McL0608]|uniref:acyl-CoA thioesterase/bile acid-CoA:amino acid N-acyltransferase family protein n=1 Tax=Leifsonia sp. McL0608 TaxID=3143537 RepID=UPI0031F2F250